MIAALRDNDLALFFAGVSAGVWIVVLMLATAWLIEQRNLRNYFRG